MPSFEPSSTAMISNVSARVGQGLERLVHQALEVGLLVVRREEVGQARDAGREGRLRVGHPRIVRARPSGPSETRRGRRVNVRNPGWCLQPGFRVMTRRVVELRAAEGVGREGGRVPVGVVPATIVAMTVHVSPSSGTTR